MMVSCYDLCEYPSSGMGPTEVQCTERQMSNFRIPSYYAASELRVRDTSLSSVFVKTRLSTHCSWDRMPQALLACWHTDNYVLYSPR